MYSYSKEIYLKLFLIFLACFFFISIFLTWNTAANNYESSIYLSTPIFFWISLILSVFTGTYLLAIKIHNCEKNQNNLWKIGLFYIILGYILFISLFIIRGYYVWNWTGDDASHIMYINDTIKNGIFPTLQQTYVIVNIYFSELFQISSLDLIFLSKVIPLVFAALFILFMYIFSKVVFIQKDVALLVVVLSCCFILCAYLSIAPNILANFYVPFGMYVIIRTYQHIQSNWLITLGLVLILYPVFHLIPAIFLFIFLLSIIIVSTALKLKINPFYNNFLEKNLMKELIIIIITSIFSFTALVFVLGPKKVNTILNTNYLGAGLNHFQFLFNQISYAQSYGYNVFEQALKVYGSTFLLFSLSVFLLIYRFLNQKEVKINRILIALIFSFLLISLFIIGLFGFSLPFSPLRFIVYLNILAVLFSAYFLYLILREKHRLNGLFNKCSKIKILSISIIIIILFLLGMFNHYPSPYKLTPSYHTTHSEVISMDFFFNHRDINMPIKGIMMAPTRFSHALLTPEERRYHKIPGYDNKSLIVPLHFGYDNYSSLAPLLKQKTDLLITQRDKVLYSEVFPSMAKYRFTESDFQRLNIDPNLAHIYSNSGFDYYKLEF